MQVILDSNVIVDGDWNLAQTSAQALLAACRRGEIELFVPQIVISEVTRSFKDREEKKLRTLNDARAALRELRGLRAEAGELAGDLTSKPGYVTHLVTAIRQAGGQVIEYPEVAHRDLVERALLREAPFDNAGRAGYRDALIWHNVLDVARSGQLVVFATDDNDFREPKSEKLNSRMVEDLQRRGIDPGRVSLARSLKEVVEEVVQPAQAVLDVLNGQLSEAPEWSPKLTDALKDVADTEAAYADLSEVDVAFDADEEAFIGEVTDEHLTEVYDLQRFAMADAVPLSEHRFGIEVWLDATASFDVEVSPNTASGQASEIPPGVELGADETSASLVGVAELRLIFEVEYDQGTANLGTPRLVRVLSRPAESGDEGQGASSPRRPRKAPQWISLQEGEDS
jgi:predicted nucleic acid-binding protein